MDNEINQAKEKLIFPWPLLKAAALMYQDRLKKYWQMYLYVLAGFVPLIIVTTVFVSINFIKLPLAQEQITNITFGLLGLCSVLFLIYFSVRAKVGVMLVCSENQDVSAKELFKKSKQYFSSYLGVSILIAIFTLLWTLLFIIPGIIFSVYYSFAAFIVVYENKKAMAAIKQSKNLIKGYWWAIFGRLAYVVIFIMIINILLSSPNYFLPKNSLALNIWELVVRLIIVLISPVALFYNYLLYKNISTIKNQ